MKKEEIMQKLTMASIYTSVVAVAYVAKYVYTDL